MNSKILTRAVEAVAFVLAAFNGFFTNWAPPTQQFSKLSFEVGLISVASLILLLLVIAIKKKLQAPRSKIFWLVIPLAICGVTLGIFYKTSLDKYVVEYPPGSKTYEITGETPDGYTKAARDFVARHPEISKVKLIAAFRGSQSLQVWTESSVNEVQSKLSILYIIFVLMLVVSVFILAEGRLADRE